MLGSPPAAPYSFPLHSSTVNHARPQHITAVLWRQYGGTEGRQCLCPFPSCSGYRVEAWWVCVEKHKQGKNYHHRWRRWVWRRKIPCMPSGEKRKHTEGLTPERSCRMGKLEECFQRMKEKSDQVLWQQSWHRRELPYWCVQTCTYQEWPFLSLPVSCAFGHVFYPAMVGCNPKTLLCSATQLCDLLLQTTQKCF